jgi:hypothetical protein
MLSAASAVPQRRGANDYSNASLPFGIATIVAAASNLNGIIVRTAAIVSVASGYAILKASTVGVFIIAQGTNWTDYRGMGLLISPGLSLAIDSSIAGGQAYLTYDIL